jgi:uncharacterized protein YegP (UPF0339 family)
MSGEGEERTKRGDPQNSFSQEDSMYKFEVYKDKGGEYRWRLVAPNGQSIADSGEGYSSKESCLEGIASVKKNAPNAQIVEV